MIKSKIYYIRDLISREGFSYDKLAIVLAACVIITYILTPSFNLPGVEYRENDIVLNDIIVWQNMLIEDEYATELKKENLIKEMPIHLNYDPTLTDKLIERLKTSFREANQMILDIDAEEKAFSVQFFQLTDKHVALNSSISEHNQIISGYQKARKFYLSKLAEARSRNYSKITRDLYAEKTKRLLSLIGFHQNRINLITQEIGSLDKMIAEWKQSLTRHNEDINAKRGKIIRDFAGEYGITLSEQESRKLIESAFSQKHVSLLVEELEKYKNNKIIDVNELPKGSQNNSLYITEKQGDDPQILRIFNVSVLEELRKSAGVELINRHPDEDPAVLETVKFLVEKLLGPNLSVNREKMNAERERLSNDTDKVYISLTKGDTLAKRGQRLNAKSVFIVNEYFRILQSYNVYPLTIGLFLMCCFMFGAVFIIFCKIKLLYNSRYKNIAMIAMICIFHVVLNFVVFRVLVGLTTEYPLLNTLDIMFFALPLALAPMLTAILVGFEAALIVTLITSIFSVIMFDNLGVIGLFYALISGIFSAYILGRNYSRIDLLVQGIKVSLFNVPLMLVCMLFIDGNVTQEYWLFLLSPLLSGIASAVFAMFLYPLLEVIFDITTDLKLLELSNIHHPALKNLMVNAPGSYQHSIMVGTLAEAGAIKVGGNSLLCRVASYYHDIGKTYLPEFFIENVDSHTENAHIKLNDPYKSAETIIKHVSEGIKLAKQHNLGKAIIDMISQHHGTSTTIFFYNKAIEAALAEGKPAASVDRNLFRYPGPKPQSIEAAIVMLADSCEAATRSLPNPTRENVEKMIHKIGRTLLSEGQLDDSGISLKDFQNLIKSFSEMLSTIYHKRIPYPEVNVSGTAKLQVISAGSVPQKPSTDQPDPDDPAEPETTSS